MLKNFLTKLTEVTDFFIIWASIFVVLAFLDPVEIPVEPLIDEANINLSKALNDGSCILYFEDRYFNKLDNKIREKYNKGAFARSNAAEEWNNLMITFGIIVISVMT